MEATLRTLGGALSGHILPNIEYEPVRGLHGIKEYQVDLETDRENSSRVSLNIAICHQMANVRKLLSTIEDVNQPRPTRVRRAGRWHGYESLSRRAYQVTTVDVFSPRVVHELEWGDDLQGVKGTQSTLAAHKVLLALLLTGAAQGANLQRVTGTTWTFSSCRPRQRMNHQSSQRRDLSVQHG